MLELDIKAEFLRFANHRRFKRVFEEASDAQGTPFSDLYGTSHLTVIFEPETQTAPGTHRWLDRDRHIPRLAALYQPDTASYLVISFVVDDIPSATELNLHLYDIFMLGRGEATYLWESHGVALHLGFDFENAWMFDDIDALMIHAEDHDLDIEPVLDRLWHLLEGP